MEKAFKHCRIVLIPSLRLSLPLRQPVYTCTINLSASVMHQWCSPARDMSHPREKLDPVSTWKSSVGDTIGKVIDNIDGVIFFRCNWREAIDNGNNSRCCSPSKVVVPLRGLCETVTSKDDSFRRLFLVNLFDCAFAESIIGCLAHPAPTRGLYFR